jgi:orotidine-5'-phosphate decarboxylase
VPLAFADRLIQRVRALGHPLCVGLDPHLDSIPALFREGSMAPGEPATASAVERFCLAFLDRAAFRVSVVKPQSAFFEQLGPAGIGVLARMTTAARERGLLVLLDAKRGDIGSTAEGYAAAYLRKDAPMLADALTVNPWLGLETLDPYFDAAAESGGGVFTLVKTSNPGSGDFQDREISGSQLHLHLADSLTERADRLRGRETGWSGVGAVVGATKPEQARLVREHLPDGLFLVPGYGFQGGAAGDAVAGFVPGPDGRLEGGVVSSSRGVLFPSAASEATTADEWERAIDTAIDKSIHELATAIER